MAERVLLVHSTDKAAVQAVGTALRARKITFERIESDDRANRPVELWVNEADREVAMNVAGPILARRAKFKAYPPIRPLPKFPGDPDDRTPDITGNGFSF